MRSAIALLVGLCAIAGCATSVDDGGGLVVGHVDASKDGTSLDADVPVDGANDSAMPAVDSTVDDTGAPVDTGNVVDTGEAPDSSPPDAEFPDFGPDDTGSVADTGSPSTGGDDGTCTWCTTGVCKGSSTVDQSCWANCYLSGYLDCTYDKSASPACSCHD